MPRKPLNLDDMALDSPPPPISRPDPEPSAHVEPTGEGWDAFATVYARIPAPLYEKLRRRAFEMTRGRKRVTQQDVLVAALKAYLGE
jgi:hypothetical protein